MIVGLLAGAVASIGAVGEFDIVYRFPAGPRMATPSSALTQAPDGSLCGAAEHGGVEDVGILYCTTTSGVLSIFHSFTREQGSSSATNLVVGIDGIVYGTNRARDDHELGAGVPPERAGSPFGAMFRIAPDGRYGTIHTFSARDDGAYPANSLVLGSDGNLYGTTNVRLGRSGIFKATADGVVSLLHEFAWVTDGSPNTLIQASDGSLYGTTATGGLGLNAGTIFRLSLSGTFTIVHVFQRAQANEGAGPIGLVEGSDGNLYGTTLHGGREFGTVFKVTREGRFTTLRSFAGTDGAFPGGGLVIGPDQALYGTTNSGGTTGYGTIFRLSTTGEFKTLHTMTEPGTFFPLTVGRDGNLYGARTATALSSPGGGIVFRVIIPE